MPCHLRLDTLGQAPAESQVRPWNLDARCICWEEEEQTWREGCRDTGAAPKAILGKLEKCAPSAKPFTAM